MLRGRVLFFGRSLGGELRERDPGEFGRPAVGEPDQDSSHVAGGRRRDGVGRVVPEEDADDPPTAAHGRDEHIHRGGAAERGIDPGKGHVGSVTTAAGRASRGGPTEDGHGLGRHLEPGEAVQRAPGLRAGDPEELVVLDAEEHHRIESGQRDSRQQA